MEAGRKTACFPPFQPYRRKVEASVARCLRTPPRWSYPLGLDFRLSNRSRGLSNRSIVVIRNYRVSPITVVQCRAKESPLHPRRSYFAPAGTQPANAEAQPRDGFWWRRRVPPPGPNGLFRHPFIAIAGLLRQNEYRHPAGWRKEASRTKLIFPHPSTASGFRRWSIPPARNHPDQ